MTEARQYTDPVPEEDGRTVQAISAEGVFGIHNVKPLSTRPLSTISIAVASAAQSLYAAPRTMLTVHESKQASFTIQFSLESPSEHALWVKIGTTHHSFWLEIRGGSNRTPLGDRAWHQYEGENQLLAWSLAHETFLQHLSLLLNDACTPQELTDVAPTLPNGRDILLCPWVYRCGTDVLMGCCHWTAEQWGDFSASPLWQLPAGKAQAPWRRNLRFPCRLWLQGHRYSGDEIRQFDTGDCLLVTGTFTTGLALRLQPAHSQYVWKADIKKGQLIVKQGPETLADGQPDNPVTSEKQDPQKADSTLPTLEVELTFELGSLTLPLHTVEQLQAGYVMELPSELDESHVLLRANGTRIGSGRLVAIGDHLGVQLTSLSYDQTHNGV